MPEHAQKKLLGDLQPSLVLSNKELSEYESLTLEIQDYRNIALSDIKEINHSCDGGDTAAALFSGGTTDIPKQINHSHKSITFMVDRMEWGWPTKPNENWLVVVPFSHIYGFLTGMTNPSLKSGPFSYRKLLILNLLSKN